MTSEAPSAAATPGAPAWDFSAASAPIDHASLLTTFDGTTFCVSARSGDIDATGHGLFCLDRRLLSRWVIRLDGRRPHAFTTAQEEPYSAIIVARGDTPPAGSAGDTPPAGSAGDTPPAGSAGDAESGLGDLLVVRRRYVGGGMREDVELRNLGRHPAQVAVDMEVAADLADIFAVKHGRVRTRAIDPEVDGDRLTFHDPDEGASRRIEVTFTGSPELSAAGARWSVELPAGGRWQACAAIAYRGGAGLPTPDFRCGEPAEEAPPARRAQQWLADGTKVSTTHTGLRLTLDRSVSDLGSLRLFDGRGGSMIAAGAPWYMAPFGRDALLTSWMALVVDPELAAGTLETLARLQGTRHDPATEEQPGKILHEMRGATRYYGTVDATPLFVMLLGEAHRWGMPRDRVEALLPAADAAIGWMSGFGDPGYLTYRAGAGLVHQGWKDSPDGVLFANGAAPVHPIAVCEAQGYAYAAFLARAALADAFDQPNVGAGCRDRAARLRTAFNRDFRLPGGGYALALDGARRPVDTPASNQGHCLWTGIVDSAAAPAVARLLLSPTMFSGWGIRTVATTSAAYHPLSYHNGSVWPHDTAIAVAGLMRYGFVDAAQRAALAVLAAAEAFDGRLPELFAGLDRADVPVPVSYPSSCSPQAWAAGAPLLLLRSLLRLDPHCPDGRLRIAPAVPAVLGPLSLDGLRLGNRRLHIDVAADGAVRIAGAAGLDWDFGLGDGGRDCRGRSDKPVNRPMG